MNILMDIINEIDRFRETEGVEKLKDKLGCISEEEYLKDVKLVDAYPLYSDYLTHMYKDYVDDELIRRNGWSKYDIFLQVDKKGNKANLKPFMSDIGIEGFPYSKIDYKKEDDDTMAGYKYGIVVVNPEKFSDSEINKEILRNNSFASIKYEDMYILENALNEVV